MCMHLHAFHYMRWLPYFIPENHSFYWSVKHMQNLLQQSPATTMSQSPGNTTEEWSPHIKADKELFQVGKCFKPCSVMWKDYALKSEY